MTSIGQLVSQSENLVLGWNGVQLCFGSLNRFFLPKTFDQSFITRNRVSNTLCRQNYPCGWLYDVILEAKNFQNNLLKVIKQQCDFKNGNVKNCNVISLLIAYIFIIMLVKLTSTYYLHIYLYVRTMLILHTNSRVLPNTKSNKLIQGLHKFFNGSLQTYSILHSIYSYI